MAKLKYNSVIISRVVKIDNNINKKYASIIK